MKKFLVLGCLLILFGITLNYKEEILESYYTYFYSEKKVTMLENRNEYYRDYDFLFVKNVDDFRPKNKRDLINIFYTVINSGIDSFSFYCPKDYKGCLTDVKKLARDQITLSNINNYVHPYNSFKHIQTQTDTLGKVEIKVEKSYTKTDIKLINSAIETIEKEIFNDNLSLKDQIKVIHDYIIDNSKYDSNRTDNDIVEYKSDIAYGPLIEGFGICGGYSDAMELFLEDLGVKSYKVSSSSHVWNAVYLYNKWYHLDLTWDDPVTNTGEDLIEDKFFLISTDDLLSLEKTQHTFDENIYLEFKNKKDNS